MAGVDVGGGGNSKRKSLDSEINMIPMIDLLLVTISFLLITAVWTHMARVNANAQLPGPPREDGTKEEPKKQLHVEMRQPDKFVLAWKQGTQTLDSVDVPRKDDVQKVNNMEIVRYPQLAEKIEEEWKAKGLFKNATDKELDQAILHTDNKTEYKYIIAVIDAIYRPKREMELSSKKRELVPAFNVTFSVN